MTEAIAADKNLEYYLKLPYPVQLTHQREDADEYWLAQILDLPGCMSDGVTPDEAMENLEEAKQLWIETQLEDGFEVPEPTGPDDYSGKFLVRMPKTLHGRLAAQAKREGISLNQHVIVLLSNGGNVIERVQQARSSIDRVESKVDALTSAFIAMRAHPMSVPNPNMGRFPANTADIEFQVGRVFTAEVVGSADVDPPSVAAQGQPYGLMIANRAPLTATNYVPQLGREWDGDFVGTGPEDAATRLLQLHQEQIS